jgi:hypothetical protein
MINRVSLRLRVSVFVRCVVCSPTSTSLNGSLIKGVAVDVDDRWFQTDTTYEYLMQQESGVKAISFKRFDNAKDSGWIRVEVLSEFTERMSFTYIFSTNYAELNVNNQQTYQPT